jgi:hypothetical protein
MQSNICSESIDYFLRKNEGFFPSLKIEYLDEKISFDQTLLHLNSNNLCTPFIY